MISKILKSRQFWKKILSTYQMHFSQSESFYRISKFEDKKKFCSRLFFRSYKPRNTSSIMTQTNGFSSQLELLDMFMAIHSACSACLLHTWRVLMWYLLLIPTGARPLSTSILAVVCCRASILYVVPSHYEPYRKL